MTITAFLAGSRPDRLNALFLGVSALPQALGVYALTAYIMPRGGVQQGFQALALAMLIGGAFAIFVKLPADPVVSTVEPRIRFTRKIWYAFCGMFFQNAAIAAAWSYLERIGEHDGFTADVIGTALAGNIAMQVAGALVTAWLGLRIPLRAALVIGAVVQAAIIGWILGLQSGEMFIAAALLFGFFWPAMGPFQLRLLLALEPTKVAATWSVAVTLIGISFGPFAAAMRVRANDVSGAFWAAIALFLGAAAMYAIASRPQKAFAVGLA